MLSSRQFDDANISNTVRMERQLFSAWLAVSYYGTSYIWKARGMRNLADYLSLDFERIFRYLLAGGAALAVYYAVLWLSFSFAGLPYVGAVTISCLFSIIFHFSANRSVTFGAGSTRLRGQIWRYVVLAFLNYGIQLGVISLCYDIYGLNFYLSAFFGVIPTVMTGYLLMNTWVFRER